MNTDTFRDLPPPKEDVIDTDDFECLRLRCGHAYHISCILPAFRAGMKCPICRDDLTPSQSNALLHAFEDAFENVSVYENNVDPLLQHIRCTNSAVKRARTELNECYLEYKKGVNEIKKVRSDLLKQALKELRRTEKKKHQNLLRGVRICLENVSKEENKALTTHNGHSDEQVFPAKVKEYVRDSTECDPVQMKFWRR